jgi:two-component system, cell cycle sensor histidine kinase and response regulator CckA
VQLAITDDGVGIPPERLPDLFEAGRTTKTTGAGTGLARVKALCERYGGRAIASSTRGATTFTLTFPA